jgi:hypothetical protein
VLENHRQAVVWPDDQHLKTPVIRSAYGQLVSLTEMPGVHGSLCCFIFRD